MFGDALNPFYYLGAIAYYLLWVVVASGLYLYIFFKTGVNEAYDSVEYLTHEQWWLGGIMRSLHRYASDGWCWRCCCTSCATSRSTTTAASAGSRGCRGVILLWLVYISGINGYMLPWDRLAQFVTVATAEWLDWLPVFNGALVRNFITPDSRQRPAVLAAVVPAHRPAARRAGLLWMHTQRVPGREDASAAPDLDRRHARAARAVARQAGACPGRPPTSPPRRRPSPFDWFYLPVYPLIYALVARRGVGARRRR